MEDKYVIMSDDTDVSTKTIDDFNLTEEQKNEMDKTDKEILDNYS